ncbi:MAG: Regulatory protein MerR [Candidatus Tokpelaia hoelldobleri]|uniref:Regulatory protein MerR n=1 Tax=Candidatus Tokpelaia hoelldobleri TaxID=1902579 RepID=A0A1U9JUF1_9HYPH|nr:MAG: Regulatory protein MerR [Candidatus Tokpelaia hoelldoblerii]
MSKSPDAFRTISEVAEMLDLPQHVLRFWETRFTQIKPMKRGGGRRYYRPADVDFLKGIKHLLYERGYTIKGVQKLLKENGTAFVSAVGSGDVKAVEEIMRKQQVEQVNDLFPEDILPEDTGNGRTFFGLLKTDEDKAAGNRRSKLSKDNSTLLQETLFELIECKRLLDRARTEI